MEDTIADIDDIVIINNALNNIKTKILKIKYDSQCHEYLYYYANSNGDVVWTTRHFISHPNKAPENVKKLFDIIDEKDVKITFGLTPKDIEVIESKFKKYPNFKYNTTIWNDIGKEIGWCSLTAALYYFRYLENKDK